MVTAERDAAILAARQEGALIKDLAAEHGMHRCTVRKILDQQGWTPPAPSLRERFWSKVGSARGCDSIPSTAEPHMTQEDHEPRLDFCVEGNGGHCYRWIVVLGRAAKRCIVCAKEIAC